MISILAMFAISLGLTLVLEYPVCWFFGIQNKKTTILFLLLNIMTNPTAVLLSWLGLPQIPIELGVFAAEWFVYHSFSKHHEYPIRHPMLMALFANVLSYGLGLLIPMI